MDLDALIRKVHAARTAAEPLYFTAERVWAEGKDSLDSADQASFGAIGLMAIHQAATVPPGYRRLLRPATVAAALAGEASWKGLTPADQDTLAMLGFLVVVAERFLHDDAPRVEPRLN
jgi:hypothetical protein